MTTDERMTDELIVTCKSCDAKFGFDLYFENNGFCQTCWTGTFACDTCGRQCNRTDAHAIAWTHCNTCIDRWLETPLFDPSSLTELIGQIDQIGIPSFELTELPSFELTELPSFELTELPSFELTELAEPFGKDALPDGPITDFDDVIDRPRKKARKAK
jgi:hypothetical protein